MHHDCDLVCDNGIISSIGKNIAATLDADVPRIDGRNLFVYPGLVNTHHHFFQAFVRNQLQLEWSTLSLVEWLGRIYRIFSLINEDCIYHSSMVSMAELLKHGCTTAFDHQYCFNKHAGSYLIDRQFAAAQRTGIRFVAGRGTNTLPREEGSTMPEQMLETTEDYLRDCERIIHRYHDGKPFAMHSVALAPCQPINCRPETFRETITLARAHGLSMHTHLSEGENALMLARHGKRSLDWCIDTGFCGPDVWIAHGWEMSREELFRMARHDIGLSHCAPAMCLVGDGTTDLAAAYAAGVRIGLGVDGQASNDNSNLLECVRLAHLLQCLVGKDREDPVPPPLEFLRFATAGGASLLNRPELGSLEVGKAADFFAINSSDISYVGATHDPALLPVKTGVGKPVDLTVVDGKVLWQNAEFTGFDEFQVAAEADAVFQDVIYTSQTMHDLRNGML